MKTFWKGDSSPRDEVGVRSGGQPSLEGGALSDCPLTLHIVPSSPSSVSLPRSRAKVSQGVQESS